MPISPSELPPPIDWDQAPYPSNRLTVGDLRRAVGAYYETLGETLHDLAKAELEFAQQAVMEAVGTGGEAGRKLSRQQKDKAATELLALYPKVGLANGPHEAAELVRHLEAWALAETRKHVPDKSR